MRWFLSFLLTCGWLASSGACIRINKQSRKSRSYLRDHNRNDSLLSSQSLQAEKVEAKPADIRSKSRGASLERSSPLPQAGELYDSYEEGYLNFIKSAVEHTVQEMNDGARSEKLNLTQLEERAGWLGEQFDQLSDKLDTDGSIEDLEESDQDENNVTRHELHVLAVRALEFAELFEELKDMLTKIEEKTGGKKTLADRVSQPGNGTEPVTHTGELADLFEKFKILAEKGEFQFMKEMLEDDEQRPDENTTGDSSVAHAGALRYFFEKLADKLGEHRSMEDAEKLQAADRFGLSLFKNMCQERPGKDVLFCPLSLSTSLSMAAAGVTKGSASEKAFQELLGSASCPTSVAPGNSICGPWAARNNYLDVSNSAWIKGPIKDSYIATIKTSFGAEAFELSGSDPQPINEWVEEKTHGRITSMLETVDPGTVLILISTLFFKGTWTDSFDVSRTIDSVFRPFEGEPKACNLMCKDDKQMMFAESPDAVAVRLPYAQGDLSATVMLPTDEGPQALDNLVTSLTPDAWASWNLQLNREKRHVKLHLPRFKLEFAVELTTTLQRLGLEPAFQSTGQFLQISNDPSVAISSVIQKAAIEVNEEGTVAAAATAVALGRSVAMPYLMKVDRPFLFVINESDGTVIFWVRVVRPTLSGIAANLGE